MRVLLSVVLFSMITFVSSFAADRNDVLNELSSQYTQCHAYYQIFRECAKDQLDEKSSKDFEDAAEMASRLSIEAGLMAGVKGDALLARTEMVMKSFMDEMNKSCKNISLLLNRYAESCKSLMQDPKAHLEQLMKTIK